MTKEKKEEAVVEVAEPKKAKDTYSIYAWFAYVDKEGFKVKSEYKGEGATVAEMLAGVEFPAGVNRLVNVTVTHNGRSYEKALAPHKARAILEMKSVFDFNEAFRGI